MGCPVQIGWYATVGACAHTLCTNKATTLLTNSTIDHNPPPHRTASNKAAVVNTTRSRNEGRMMWKVVVKCLLYMWHHSWPSMVCVHDWLWLTATRSLSCTLPPSRIPVAAREGGTGRGLEPYPQREYTHKHTEVDVETPESQLRSLSLIDMHHREVRQRTRWSTTDWPTLW